MHIRRFTYLFDQLSDGEATNRSSVTPHVAPHLRISFALGRHRPETVAQAYKVRKCEEIPNMFGT